MATEIEPRTGNARTIAEGRRELAVRTQHPRAGVNDAPRIRRARDGDGDALASVLGWFSVGLGLAQLAGPARLARLVGADDDEQTTSLMRLLGMRELASGIGILSSQRPAAWMNARVGGDLMDLALLAPLMRRDHPERSRAALAAAAVAGVGVLDAICARRLARDESDVPDARPVRGRRAGVIPHRNSVTIARPPDEIYRFWRDFTNLPRFMRHLESVQVLDDRRSRWRATAPAGRTVEWEAEIVEDRPNERIAWRSLPGADVWNEGWVRFAPAPGGRGTEVRVHFSYDPPGGVVGTTVAKLFREEPGQQVADDLRHLKQVLETGDVVVSDATVLRGPHPAQPREPAPHR